MVSTCFDKNGKYGNQWENVANEPYIYIYKFSGETFTLFRFIPVHSIGKFFVASKRMFENAFLRLTGAILAIRVIKNSTVNFYSSCTGGSALFLPGILFLHFYFFTHPFSFFLFSPLPFFFQKLAFEFFFGEQQLSIVILFSMKLYRDLKESFISAGWKFLWWPNLKFDFANIYHELIDGLIITTVRIHWLYVN